MWEGKNEQKNKPEKANRLKSAQVRHFKSSLINPLLAPMVNSKL